MNEQVYKILIVDDSAEDRVTCRRYLENISEVNYEFLEAAFGDEGIEICRSEKPDCILLDYYLPDGDGLSVMREINSDPLYPEFPIVLLSVSSSEVIAVNALKNGAQDYLVKGKISPEDLHLSIQKAIETVKLRNEKLQALADLRQSETRLKLGIKVADFAVIEVNYFDNTTHFSKEAARLYGFGDEEITVPRERVHATFHPDDREELSRLIEKSLNPDGDGWFEKEHRIVLENGEVRWLSVRKQIFFDRRTSPPRPTHGILAAQNITERKKSAENLRVSEARLKLAMKGANIGTFDWNIKTDEIIWSHEIEEASELTTDDFNHSIEGLMNIVHPLDREILQSRIEEGLKTGEYECEFRMLKGDGKIRWVLGKGRVMYDETGEPARLLGVDIDITNRKLTEEKLRESQIFTERIIETAPSVIYTFDLNTKTPTYVTKQAAAILGYTFEEYKEISADIFRRFMHPEDTADTIVHFEKIKRANGDEVFELEYRMLHKSGEWRWFRSRDMVFKRGENGEAQEILGVALDITERKNIAEKLRESRERLEATNFNAPIGIVETTLDGNYLSVNDEFCRITGYTKDELLKLNPKDLTHTEDFPRNFAFFKKLAAGKIPSFQIEKRFVHKDGSEVWVEVKRILLKHADGKPSYVVGAVVDISDRKKTEDRLRRNHDTFFNLIENAPFGIYIVDSEFKLMQFSKGSRKAFSNIESPLGRDFAEILRILWEEPFASEVIAHFHRTLETGEPYRAANTTEQRSDIEETESYDWKIERITLPDGSFGVVCYFYDLTERLQFEEKLRESEERMRLVLNAAKIGIWIYDFADESIFWSPEHYEIFRTQEFDGTIEGFFKFVHPDDAADVWSQFNNSVANGILYQPEFRIVRPNGEICWVGNYGHVEYDADGKPLRLLGMVFDITERKRRELNLAFLADLQKQLSGLSQPEEIMQAAGSGILNHLDLTHCLFVEINGTLDEAVVLHDAKIRNAQSLSGKYKLEDFHSEKERKMHCAGKGIVINDTKYDLNLKEGASNFEKLGVRALTNAPYISDGRWKFTLTAMHGEPHHWRTDELELLQSLSARIYARLERARAEESLRDSEEKYRALFDSIDEGFCIIEMMFDENEKPFDYRFVQVNPAMERLTGLKDALGKTARELVPGLEDFWFETYGNAALTGDTIHFENKSEPLNRWFDVSAKRIGDASSRQIALVFNNITERKIAEIEKEKLLENETLLRREAEAANRTKENFLAMLSHELRTPLNAMSGWTQILKSSGNPALIKQGLEVIDRNVKLQSSLIEDLLDVSRIISGKMRLECENFSLVSTVETAIDAIRPTAEKRSVEIIPNLDQNADDFYGDKNRLEQITNNLLTNAVKFTPEKGRITVSLERQNDKMKLIVSDTGIGIAPELLPHVFDRFRQADDSTKRQFGGLGLGLAIVKNLVELHGGIISAFSGGENKGSTFIIELPFNNSEKLPPAPQLKAEKIVDDVDKSETKQTASLNGFKILVVDDIEEVINFMGFLLESNGAEIICVSSAKDALAKLESEKFDLLISDLGMPEMDGYDLIREMRGNEKSINNTIPAIALTGYVSAADREKVLLAGFQTHLPKPVNIENLLSAAVILIKNHNPSKKL